MTASTVLRRVVGIFGNALLFSLHLLFGLLLCLYLGYKVIERQTAIDALPEGIEPSSVVLLSGEIGGREGCGAAVFRLSGHTRKRLLQEGAMFLETARQARGYASTYYSYEPWQGTPVPGGFTSEGGWPSLWCAGVDARLARRIHGAMQAPGAFYSIKHEGLLLLIPDEGLIVSGYDG
jgi:hypothetical protein